MQKRAIFLGGNFNFHLVAFREISLEQKIAVWYV